jgi:hypothetical protein
MAQTYRPPAQNANDNDRIGFALGGLGGFNAHGVGFLQAARKAGVTPAIITCTSGMVAWAARWLAGEDLEPLIMTQVQQDTKFPPSLDWLNALWILWFGDPGICRPALGEYFARWLTPISRREELFDQLLNRLLPAQMAVPVRTHETMEYFARSLNNSSIPVAFNTLHPKSGRAYVHVNPAAQNFLEVEKLGEVGGQDKYLPITTDAVGGALWLYFYGFEHPRKSLNPLGLVDGAYNRQFIISELHKCDRIYTVRPLNTRWLEHPPRNYLESQDFTNWMWINSAYTAETDGIESVNRFIGRGDLTGAQYHEVDLIEISVDHHYSLLQYLYEKREVYEQSFQNSMSKLLEREGLLATPLTASAK